MDARLLSAALITRAAWRRRDAWPVRRLTQHQDQAMAALRTHAYSRSPFYRRHHAGLANAPLDELPPVTKGDLMAHWDEVVTEPALRLSEVERHLGLLTHSQGDPGVPWQGRWWAAATAGTTGRRGVFIWGRREWASVLASYARANDWAGAVRRGREAAADGCGLLQEPSAPVCRGRRLTGLAAGADTAPGCDEPPPPTDPGTQRLSAAPTGRIRLGAAPAGHRAALGRAAHQPAGGDVGIRGADTIGRAES